MDLNKEDSKEFLPIEKCQKCENGEPCPHGDNKPVTKSSTFSAWAVGIVILLFGLVMFGGLARDAVRDHRLIATGTQTVGTVTNVEMGTCGSRKHRYTCARQELTYTDQNRDKHTRQGPSVRYEKKVGEKSTFADSLYGNEYALYYDSSNPEKSVVKGEESPFWTILLTLVPIALGGFFVYAMADSAIRTRKAKKAEGVSKDS